MANAAFTQLANNSILGNGPGSLTVQGNSPQGSAQFAQPAGVYGPTRPTAAPAVLGASTQSTPQPTAQTTSAPRAATSSNTGQSPQQQWQAAGHPGIAPVGYNGESAAPQGVSDQDVNAAYDPVFSSINDLYSQAQSNQPTWMSAVAAPYDAQQPSIDTALQQGSALNQQQVGQEQNRSQNALAAARQLFNELQQGVQQRFGGTSSTGDFAKAFYGRGLQQQEGGIQNTSGQNLNALATQQQNLVSQHDANTQTLGLQKDAALKDAQNQFQQQLQQIDQLKTQTEQEKANKKLDALSTLKATANAINQQFTQFGQQQQLQHQAGLDQLRNQIAYAQSFAGKPVDLSAYNQVAASQMGGGTAQSSYNPYQAVGGTGVTRDQFGNVIQ